MVDFNSLLRVEKLKSYLPPHLADHLAADLEIEDALAIANHITSLREVLSAYLPKYLVELINQDPTPGLVDGGFRYGGVLFADVSGFTAMSEKFSVVGKEGAEEITVIVNDFFDAMLEISASYGGDLLKFGGDALLLFFEGDKGPHRAVTTADAMQAAMQRFAQVQTSQGVFPLRMSIGISSGSIYLASLGIAERMNYTVLGSTITRMAHAESKANAGEIIVDQNTCEATKQEAQYKPAEDGFWKLATLTYAISPAVENSDSKVAPTTADDSGAKRILQEISIDLMNLDALSPFVPDELLARLIFEPRRAVIQGSHRPVTMMFVNFPGFDDIIEALGIEHQDRILELLNLTVVEISEVISRFGGTISRLDPYVTGHRLMALFGAPQAHEDDPQRAVRAGVEIIQRLDDINQQIVEVLKNFPNWADLFDQDTLNQRIGVNTGFVFSGNVGSRTRREYTVMGDQVNLTARLMSVAQQGEVLIGQSTARHTENEFILQEKEAVTVKGISEPVRIFVVRGEQERPRHWTKLKTSPFVGREAELLQGQRLIEQASNGDGCVLVINGVSGIGKTRLAEEIALHGETMSMDLLAGSCLSYGSTMVYHPWAEILRALFGISLTDKTQDTQARFDAVQRGMAGINEVEWAPVIATVLGLDIPDNDLTRDLDARLRRQRVLDLTMKLLQAHAQKQPLILVIEDAHWADPASLDLIDYMVRNVAEHPILFIINHRPDEGIPNWGETSNAVALQLTDLTIEASVDIVRSLVGPITLPKNFQKLILDKCSGNPFFIGEVVRALIDTGALRQDDSENWQFDEQMEALELPDTIHGLIISRIDRLIATDRRVLQVASVVGRLFAYQTLNGVYTYSDIGDVLRERLNYLAELGITEADNVELEIYRFVHLTTRDVVYESLSFEHRRTLHRGIGEYIEVSSASSLAEQIDLLAYHFYESKAWGKALEYNLLSAKRAQREYANDTAITACLRSLEAAINLSPDVDTTQERLSTYEILCDILTLVGKYDEALQHLSSARSLLKSDHPTVDQKRTLAEFCRKTADVYERRSEYEVAFSWLNKGLGYLEEYEPTIEIAKINIMAAGIYHRQGENDEAIRWCRKILELASRLKTREGQQSMAQVYYLMGAAYYRLGLLQEAAEQCKSSVQIYQEIDDLVGQARAYNNLAIAYTDLGDWANASQAYHKSLEINERIGNIQELGFVANNLAEIHRDHGEWDTAIDLYLQSNAIWKQIGGTLPDAVTLSNLAQVYIYQQNWAEARKSLTNSQRLFAEIGSNDFMPELERRWGEFYLNVSETDRAMEHLTHSIELASTQDAQFELGISFRVLGEAHMARKDFEQAEIALLRSRRILNDLNSEYEAAKTTLSLTQLAFEAGDAIDQQALRRATSVFSRLGAQVDLNRAILMEQQLNNTGSP